MILEAIVDRALVVARRHNLPRFPPWFKWNQKEWWRKIEWSERPQKDNTCRFSSLSETWHVTQTLPSGNEPKLTSLFFCVYCLLLRLVFSTANLTMLWRICYQQEDRHLKNWCQFVNYHLQCWPVWRRSTTFLRFARCLWLTIWIE